MKEVFERYYFKSKKFVQRYWMRLKQVNYMQLLRLVGVGLVALPGMIAWLLEIIALGAAIKFISMAAHQAYTNELWSAFVLVALSGLMVAIAHLTDRYTASQNRKDGGGG